jgi:hypothetical protein
LLHQQQRFGNIPLTPRLLKIQHIQDAWNRPGVLEKKVVLSWNYKCHWREQCVHSVRETHAHTSSNTCQLGFNFSSDTSYSSPYCQSGRDSVWTSAILTYCTSWVLLSSLKQMPVCEICGSGSRNVTPRRLAETFRTFRRTCSLHLLGLLQWKL